MKTLRIGIDCRLAGWQHAGIGRYTENLILRLPSLAAQLESTADIHWVLFFHDGAQAEAIQAEWPANVELRFVPVRHYSLQEQWVMTRAFMAANLDLLHVPHFNIPWAYMGKLVVTIHDLLWHEQRGSQVTTLKPWVYWIKYWFYLITVYLAVTKAKAILVPAETIKTTVAKYYPQALSKIVVTKEGLDDTYRKLSRQLIQNGLPPAISQSSQPPLKLVYTGSLYPHKNVQVILQALAREPQWHLTIVGARSVFRDQLETQIRQLKIESQVTLAGYVNDVDLIKLYQTSHALVQPSLSEGFGLTGIEAMASGTLVLASDIPIFKEIYQTAAIYFNPQSVSNFVIAAQYVQTLSPAKRRDRLKTALELVQNYDWKVMAQETWNTYLSVQTA